MAMVHDVKVSAPAAASCLSASCHGGHALSCKTVSKPRLGHGSLTAVQQRPKYNNWDRCLKDESLAKEPVVVLRQRILILRDIHNSDIEKDRISWWMTLTCLLLW